MAYQREHPDREKNFEFPKLSFAINETLNYFEESFNCSGLCQPGLFWYSKDIDSRPTKSCLSAVKSEVGDQPTYVGASILAISVSALLLFFAQCPLWLQ